MAHGIVTDMKNLLLLIVLALPLSAQTRVDDQFTIQNGTVGAIRAYLETNHIIVADTDENGAISNAEAIAWYSARRQETADTFTKYAIDQAVLAYRADQTLTALPADARTLLNNLLAAEAAWKAKYDQLVSGQ